MPWCSNCKAEYCEELYLTTACDLLEADVIGSILTAFGIPYNLKFRGAGDYIKVVYGITSFGVEIYVPDTAYLDAVQLLGGEFELEVNQYESEECEFDEVAFDSWYRRHQLRRRIAAIILLFV